MSAIQSLHDNLAKAFELPSSAIEWLLMIYQAIQVFDDVADNDNVTRQELDKTIWNMLVAMHHNQFWKINQDALVPLLSTMVLKWQASDIAERSGQADEKSFVWRAGYYDLVLASVQICHGPEIAIKMSKYVMQLYGEKFEDYVKEFRNA